jgi:hypothetical protein
MMTYRLRELPLRRTRRRRRRRRKVQTRPRHPRRRTKVTKREMTGTTWMRTWTSPIRPL